MGGDHLRFSSPKADTSLYYNLQAPARTCVGLVHRTVCLFTLQLFGKYQIMLLGDRGA